MDRDHHGVLVSLPGRTMPTGIGVLHLSAKPTAGRADSIRQVADPTPTHRRDGRCAVRLGLTSVQGIGQEVADTIVAERERFARSPRSPT